MSFDLQAAPTAVARWGHAGPSTTWRGICALPLFNRYYARSGEVSGCARHRSGAAGDPSTLTTPCWRSLSL